MQKLPALLIQSMRWPLEPVLTLLQKREFSARVSRSWQEVEQAYASISLDPVKYVFVDISLCNDSRWAKFIERARIAASDVILIYFHPGHLESLVRFFGAPENMVNHQAKDQKFPVVEKEPKFREALALAKRYARHDITVLITGETGAGKEILARYIHLSGPKADKPFIACNLAAVPETLVESELFGYVKGAFTGAGQNKKGLIEAAEGGTLFLDEVGDLSSSVQVKLLRFMEGHEYYKVGDCVPSKAGVRVIAATNKDLERAVLEKSFREDLYYRFNGARVILPPLRKRREDIPILTEHFIAEACCRNQTPVKKISKAVEEVLLEYPWPGNIRELKNVIESTILVSEGEYLTLGDMPMHLQQFASNHREEIGSNALRRIEDVEKDLIARALEKSEGNKTRAAKILGISTRTLYRKLDRLSLAAA